MLNTDKRGSISYAVENSIDTLFYTVSVTASYFVAWHVAPELEFAAPDLSSLPVLTWPLLCISLILRTVIFSLFGVYGKNRLLSLARETRKAVFADIIAHLLILILFLFSLRGLGEFVLVWMLTAAFVSAFVTAAKVLSYGKVRRAAGLMSYKLRRILVVCGNSENASRFIRELESRAKGNEMIIGCVSDCTDDLAGAQHQGRICELEAVIRKLLPTDVVFAKGYLDDSLFTKITHLCEDMCIGIYLIPDTGGFLRSSRQIEILGSLPLINIHATPLDTGFNAFLKRLFDIAGASALIALTIPIMLTAALLVKLSSPGPIFFTQRRVGKDGRAFTMLKFRSMTVNSGSDVAWSRGYDTRKTRFGNFIRRTSIDELPQLFNVLAGSMSLIGPRPELPHFVNSFRKTVPLYMLKHKVKPGMTGLAQIRGQRGDTSIEERINSDIEYIENWSIWLDITILFRTPFRAINRSERHAKEKTVNDSVHKTAHSTASGSYGNRKKILYVASTYSHLKNFHTDYINALRRDGYNVFTMARGEADYDIPFEKKLISPSNSACRRMMRKILKREKFDVIILNTSLAAFHVRLCLPHKGRPRVINIVHGYLFNEHTPSIRRAMLVLAEKFLSGRTDVIITMNRYDEYMAKKKRLCRERVRFCLGMGARVADCNESAVDLRERCGASDGYILVFAAELSERKNQKALIYAMPRILEIIPRAYLWLVGDGEKREELEELCRQLSISERVKFFGYTDTPGALINAADVYVSASLSEGMPFNIIEALGYGKTVLASHVKGHTDLLSGGAGVLFDPFSQSDMVEKLAAIYNGEIAIDKDKISQAFFDHSFVNTFDKTYKTIKESL